MNGERGPDLGARVPVSERIPPHLYFVGSAVFHYLGPSFAVLLFARVPVSGVAWLRIVSAGVVFGAWRRPWRALAVADTRTRFLIAALGVVFAVMNYAFYAAIDRLPLGTVAAIEFVGPIILAVIGARSWRNFAALGSATAGVYLLTDVGSDVAPDGLIWAFLNALLFTLYIILAHAVSRADPVTDPIDRLGASMLIAMIAITPLGLRGALPAFSDLVALGAGIGVGVTSSVIPYVFDQLAMARLSRSTYALFVALLPATAVVIGVLVLGQIPKIIEGVAVGFVIAGVLIHKDPESQEPAAISARAAAVAAVTSS
ncbi:MAG: EamA family transporter [Actinomycetota bacterium]